MTDPASALATAAETYLAEPRRVHIGFSGGPDSTLLLAQALDYWPRRRVVAVHVHHDWHPDADQWAQHCRRQARSLGARFRILRIDPTPAAGEGPEAGARTARYAALARELGPGEVLLTGHHRDDQAETLLLALLRGGSVHGWAGMPTCCALGSGRHLRPWLTVPRRSLRAELERRGLGHVDDPANQNMRYDRPWLREHVLPVLRERWPEVDATLARAAGQAAEAATNVDAMAAHDFVRCRGPVEATLAIAGLEALPASRQRALLRWWLVHEGLSRPPAARLETLRRQLLEAGSDRCPRVEWPGGEARRWRGLAWALQPTAPVVAGAVYPWPDRGQTLALPDRFLRAADLVRHGLDPDPDARVEIALPQGGERFRPQGTARSERLREILRRAGWPPWERDRAPLVYIDGRLVAVIGLGRGQAAGADAG